MEPWCWWNPGGTLVEPWWNPGGTLVEPWWNPRGTSPQGRPGPPRSLSGLRPQSFQLLGNKNDTRQAELRRSESRAAGPQELASPWASAILLTPQPRNGGDCGRTGEIHFAAPIRQPEMTNSCTNKPWLPMDSMPIPFIYSLSHRENGSLAQNRSVQKW